MSIRGVVEDILNLDFESDGEFNNGKWTAAIPNSNIFADLFDTLSNCSWTDIKLDYRDVDSSDCLYRFTDGQVEITLKGSFDSDQYSIAVEDR